MFCFFQCPLQNIYITVTSTKGPEYFSLVFIEINAQFQGVKLSGKFSFKSYLIYLAFFITSECDIVMWLCYKMALRGAKDTILAL